MRKPGRKIQIADGIVNVQIWSFISVSTVVVECWFQWTPPIERFKFSTLPFLRLHGDLSILEEVFAVTFVLTIHSCKLQIKLLFL